MLEWDPMETGSRAPMERRESLAGDGTATERRRSVGKGTGSLTSWRPFRAHGIFQRVTRGIGRQTSSAPGFGLPARWAGGGSDGDRLVELPGAASVTRRWDGTATERRRSAGTGTGSLSSHGAASVTRWGWDGDRTSPLRWDGDPRDQFTVLAPGPASGGSNRDPGRFPGRCLRGW